MGEGASTPSPAVFHAGARSHPFVSQGEPSSGLLAVAADRANSAGVVTEVRVQAWAGFFAFAGAGDVAVLGLEPGARAVSARFVRADSGQATEAFPVGAVDVG